MEDCLAPQFDVGFTALLEDLESRGLLADTLVVAVGEFGRTPKINANGGRDHWGGVFSAVLAGAGIAGGQVFGASDKQGATPRSTLSMRAIWRRQSFTSWVSTPRGHFGIGQVGN